MPDTSTYEPPKIWKWESESGGTWAKINRPIAGATHEKELPVGQHPLQLYSLATPNGVKVTILLEELLALGKSGAEYDAYLIKIGDHEQFGSGQRLLQGLAFKQQRLELITAMRFHQLRHANSRFGGG